MRRGQRGLRWWVPVVDHVVVEPPYPRIVSAVLEAILTREPLSLVLETSQVDRPWIQRREIRSRLHRLTMEEAGWMTSWGKPVDQNGSDWHSITIDVWNGDGLPRRTRRSWEAELLGPPEVSDAEGAATRATALLLIREPPGRFG